MKTRTFLTTLLLFLLFFNGAICAVTVFSLKSSLDTAKEQRLAEHYVVASALLQDMRALHSRGSDPAASLAQLMRPYGQFYAKRSGEFLVYRGQECLYSSISDPAAPLVAPASLAQTQDRVLTIQQTAPFYLCVAGRLSAPFQDYVLVYQSSLQQTISGWGQLCRLLYLAGAVFSLILALCLLLLLNRLFRPLEQIHAASQDIANGEYGKRLPQRGRDELAGVARSFNHMAAEIEAQMTALNNAAAQKQQFADNLAHELRTPLTAIYGYAEYLQKAALTEADHQAATGYILSECRRLQNMAAQLLETAVIRADGAALLPVDTAALFAAVRHTLLPKTAKMGAQLTFRAGLPTLYGDRDLLESLLINLADNALNACPQHAQILVEAAAEGGRAVLRVQDNGRGMTGEELARVKEAFYRVDKARSRAAGGAGLGLALCEQIAAAHGAELLFASAPGRGTTVTLRFPSGSSPLAGPPAPKG